MCVSFGVPDRSWLWEEGWANANRLELFDFTYLLVATRYTRTRFKTNSATITNLYISIKTDEKPFQNVRSLVLPHRMAHSSRISKFVGNDFVGVFSLKSNAIDFVDEICAPPRVCFILSNFICYLLSNQTPCGDAQSRNVVAISLKIMEVEV